MRFICNILIILLPYFCFASEKLASPMGAAFFAADYIEYNTEEEFIYAKGNIQIMFENYLLTSDNILYDIKNDLLWAEGKIQITDDKQHLIIGETVFFKNELKTGVISNFIVRFSDNILLASKLAKRIDENNSLLMRASFTPCQILCSGKPIWQVNAEEAHLDREKQKITYKNLFFEIHGVPVLYTPYFSHPTPQAKPQSGLLTIELKNNRIGLPLYIRAKNNLDFTITPRFSDKYIIYEQELRHKTKEGYYEIKGSFGKIPYQKTYQNEVIKNEEIYGYYLFAKGGFSKNNFNYGFDIKKASDKAYLKNYYEMHDAYLSSKIYVNKVNYVDYFLVEGIHFQGLKVNNSHNTDPLILPRIRTKNIINLTEDESTFLTVQNNTLIYKEPSGKQLGRTAFNLSLTNNQITSNGQLISLIARSREDLYVTNFNKDNSKKEESVKLARIIPELQGNWRYPFVNQVGNSNIILEPLTSLILAPNHRKSPAKFAVIDTPIYEITEDNLFQSDHYSGIDYHEYGQRLIMGVNSALNNDSNYFSLFLGKFFHKDKHASKNGENLGKINLNFNDEFDLYYRYSKDKHFLPIRDEVGINWRYDKLVFNSSMIKLSNLKKNYCTSKDINLKKNNLIQLHLDSSYYLTPSLIISGNLQLDPANRKAPIIYQTIRVTYFYDCVSISTKFYNDYTFDSDRGIKKVKSKTLSLGLKILNM